MNTAESIYTRNPDSTLDVSDNWGIATDPANERGESCTAYFDHAQVWVDRYSPDPYRDCEGWETQPILTGLAVDSGRGASTYLDRQTALARLGQDWVDEVEEAQRVTEAGE